MNKKTYGLKGLGEVFRFTLVQTFKNKAYLSSLILMLVMSILSGPYMYFAGSVGEKAGEKIGSVSAEDLKMTDVYVNNTSGVKVAVEDLVSVDSIFENVKFHENETKNEADLLAGEVILDVATTAEGYQIDAIIGNESEINESELDLLLSDYKYAFDYNRKAAVGLDEEIISMVYSSVDSRVDTEKEYNESQNYSAVYNARSGIEMAYCFILMLVITLSASFIAMSVVEERASKLAETLLMSVDPVALLMGKILAMMCYTLLMIVGMVTGFLISNAFTSTFIIKGKQGAAAKMASALNLDTIFAVLSPLNIVILVSFILLAYLACSVLTGILASSCSRQEEVGGTISGTTTITMIGYFVGIFSMQIDKEIVHIVSALVPVVGCFTSPVNYIVGNINLGIFLLSLLIQVVTVVFMMWLCGKVYKKVLVHEGKSLKLFDLFGLMKK